MASNIFKIVKNELTNTFDSLLSLTSTIQDVQNIQNDALEEIKYIAIDVNLTFNDNESNLIFYIPNNLATKFEYYILGAMGDVKEDIDEKTVDAVKEIISTICGGLNTTINAQGFSDISDLSIELADAKIIDKSNIKDGNKIYDFTILLDKEEFNLLISIDSILDIYINEEEVVVVGEAKTDATTSSSSNTKLEKILSILGDNAADNLELLLDIRLKLSVRLGNKIFLLKDIVNWDIGQIIELEQMANEPLDILINNIKVGVGEAVVVEGKFGVRIKYIGNNY